MFWDRNRRRMAGKTRKHRRARKLQVEQLEDRRLLDATGIVVRDTADQVVRDGSIISFPYSGGPSGTFSAMNVGSLPMKAYESPGMPPMPGRQGVWEFIGMGDINGDGKEDLVAKDSGRASTTPSKNGQWWVALNTGSGNNDSYSFQIWDGNIPSFGTVDGGTHQLTWADHQVADFTGDGKADVLARVRETGNWYLWTTNASGTGFTTESTGITSNSSLFGRWNITQSVDAVTDHHFQWRDALVGDFNNDGRADLAGRRITNGQGWGAVDEWYVGLGTATTMDRGETGVTGNSWWHITDWQHDSTTTVDDTTWANAVLGDFNGDGRTDIAGRAAYPTDSVGDRDGEWWVAYTPATQGNFVPTVAWVAWDHAVCGDQLHWRDIQSGDFDDDGTDDILGRTKYGEWHLLDGATGTSSVAGTWGSITTYPVVVAGDFTGDGKIDLAARDINNNMWDLSVFTSGSFPAPSNRNGYQMLNSRWRDDFFAKDDPVAELGTSLPLALLEDLGRFNPPPHEDKDPQFILGRYNADGALDWEGYGGGIPFTADYGHRYHLDFNGDDLPDVLMQLNDGQWYFSENYGNSYVTSISDMNWPLAESRTLLIGDYTGDGKLDLLSQKQIGNLSAEWYLHASRGDGTFTTDLVETRSYATSGEHVWLIGGFVGDFDNDGKDDVANLHKEVDDPNDRTWVVSVVFSDGVSPTPAVPNPTQPLWGGVFKWIKEETADVGNFLLWGVGDFNGDGADDVWGLEDATIVVGEPMLTEQHHQLWVGSGGTRAGGLAAGGVYMLPELIGEIGIDSRGSVAGRFDSSANSWDDIVLEVETPYQSGTLESRVIESVNWTLDIVDTPGRTGAEQYVLVGDLDHDRNDDLIWIGTTPDHPIDLFVRSEIETIPSELTGEVISGNGVPSYIWTTNDRLRHRKPD